LIHFLIRRFTLFAATLLVVSVIVFTLSRISGDPRLLYLTENTTDEMWDDWGKQMGLDRHVTVQYLVWLKSALTGDLGDSLREGRPVMTIVASKIPATMQLGLVSFVFAISIGILFGTLAAVKRGTKWDYAARTFALFGQALPPFWIGIVLVLIFAVQLEWLPAGRRDSPLSIIMPAITLGWLAAGANLRLVRSSMLNVLDSEYVLLARAKGVQNRTVIWKHAFRNALIAPLTNAGLILVGFISGTVVTETVFAWPGLGRMAVEAVSQNDFPLLVGAVLTISFFYLTVNLLVDLTYGLVDPRIRYS
jgi:peptide/nickel transport system permease protein